MEIRLLLWDLGNQPHLEAHGISTPEVREIVDLDDWVVSQHPRYPGQVRITGYTRNGRWLTIVLEPSNSPEVWRPVTGWDATASDVAYWRDQNPDR